MPRARTDSRSPTRPASDAELARSFGRAVAARTWQRLRLLVDVVVLYLAAGAALLAEPGSAAASSRLLAAIFPIVALAVLYGHRRGADDRLQRTALDSAVNAVTVIAIATVVTIAARDRDRRAAHRGAAAAARACSAPCTSRSPGR